MYEPENYRCQDPGCAVHWGSQGAPKAPAPPRPPADSIPEVRGGFSEVYSTKHEKLLLRMEHIERMDTIRKAFNRNRLHGAQAPMTTSDLVNACLDFVFQHRIPFHKLAEASDLPRFLAENVYRDAVSRWRQYNELF